MKHRIIHVIESLGVGGAQAMLFELYLAIEKYHPKYEQVIVLLHPNSLVPTFVNSYNVVYRVVQSIPKLNDIVLTFPGPVTVVFHKLMGSNTRILGRIYGHVPVIVINHTYSESYVYNRIGNCDGVVAVSNHMKKILVGRFRTRGEVICIHNGVNKYRYDPIEPEEKSSNVLWTGRVNSFNRIKYSHQWTQWVLNVKLPKKMIHEYVGGGGLLKEAKKRAKLYKNSPNQIDFPGMVKHFDKKISKIKSWDLFLYGINRDEGVSIAILESLASGIPVICSNHFGNKEIIENGVNGYVYKHHKHARAILTDLCNNPDKLAELKVTTEKHFEQNLDAKHMAAKYINFIEKISSQHHKNRKILPNKDKQSAIKKAAKQASKAAAKQAIKQSRKRYKNGSK